MLFAQACTVCAAARQLRCARSCTALVDGQSLRERQLLSVEQASAPSKWYDFRTGRRTHARWTVNLGVEMYAMLSGS